MRVFHGSNQPIEQVDLSRCRPYKDFGRGFYTTIYEEQAKEMAVRVALRFGGMPSVSVFDYSDECLDSGISVLKFDKPSEQWANFVLNNRSRTFNDPSDSLFNGDNKYDIVSGPVANDDLASIFRLYADGIINLKALQKGLEYRKLNNQISFHTSLAIAHLTAEDSLD